MNINRIIWKGKKGKIEGVNLIECGSEMFNIVDKIRGIFENKEGKDGCFCISEVSNRRFTWNYGIYQTCQTFFNKIVLKSIMNYEYVYLFKTGKLYKVVQ